MNDHQLQPPKEKWQVRFFTIWFGQAFSIVDECPALC